MLHLSKNRAFRKNMFLNESKYVKQLVQQGEESNYEDLFLGSIFKSDSTTTLWQAMSFSASAPGIKTTTATEAKNIYKSEWSAELSFDRNSKYKRRR